MTKLGSPDNRTVCRYCGLDSAVSHASTRECIEALEREGNRLREQLLGGIPSGIAVSQATTDRCNAGAIPARIATGR